MAVANGVISQKQQQRLSDEDTITTQTVLFPMMFGFVTPFVMRSAVLLGLPDIIAGAGSGKSLTVKQIAAELMKSNNAGSESTVDESHLQRLLNYLVAFGIFSCSTRVYDAQSDVGAVAAIAADDSDNLQYGLTAVSNLLVTKNNPSSQAPLLLLQTSDAALASWAHLHGSVFDKYPWRTAHGKVTKICTSN